MTPESPRRDGDGVVAVTGAAGGIGLEVSRRIIEEGRNVVMMDVDGESLEIAAEEITGAGSGALRVVEVDVTKRADVESAFRGLDDAKLLGLVNCAGVARNIPALETSDDVWRETMDVNALGTFLTSNAAATNMRNEGGSIVNIGSIAGSIGTPGQAAYAASKGAVAALTRVQAAEYAPFGIRVNEVVPGPVETELSRSMLNDQTRAKRMERLPIGRFADAREIASVAAFLVSEASSYMTGASVVVDGGFTIGGVAG